MVKDYIELYQILLQLNMNIKETKKNIIQAGHKAVEELIKVAKEAIVDSDDDISADRLKNAAATKKLAIFDAFEILNRIQEEENILEGKETEEQKKKYLKVLQKVDLNNVRAKFIKIVEPIKKTTISRLNKGKKWKYGYNKEHDVVVISKTGNYGEVMKYKISNSFTSNQKKCYSNKETSGKHLNILKN